MAKVQSSIGRIIESARRLRDIAGEMGQIDLKAEIIDEISTLQEIRDDVSDESNASQEDTATIAVSTQKLGDNAFAVIQPSAGADTYGIAPEPEPESELEPKAEPDNEESSKVDASGDEEKTGSSDVDKTADEGSEAEKKLPEMTEEERAKRAAMAQMRISELEPLHAVAAKKVNEVLTPEQNKIRARATKAAREAGKSKQELRQFVYAAMKLTDEQKTQLNDARKELKSVRAAIAEEVEFLLDADQKKQILQNAHATE